MSSWELVGTDQPAKTLCVPREADRPQSRWTSYCGILFWVYLRFSCLYACTPLLCLGRALLALLWDSETAVSVLEEPGGVCLSVEDDGRK